MQAMYDLVGDKIHEIFDAQVVDIGIYDRDDDLIRFPYTIERGVRFPRRARCADRRSRAAGRSRPGEPLLINDRPPEAGRGRRRAAGSIQGESPKSTLFAPLVAGGEVHRPDLAPEPRPHETPSATPTSGC